MNFGLLNSLMLLGAKAGVQVAVATPPELAPDPAIVKRASEADEGSVVVTTDPLEAAQGAPGQGVPELPRRPRTTSRSRAPTC